jgi:hypothetical protein
MGARDGRRDPVLYIVRPDDFLVDWAGDSEEVSHSSLLDDDGLNAPFQTTRLSIRNVDVDLTA